MKEIESVIGMVIKFLSLTDDCLRIGFIGSVYLDIWDNGRELSERRYMTTDDNLQDYIGATFLGVEVRPCEEVLRGYGEVLEMQFLVVQTSKGNITVCTHNDHNGYYSGISIVMDIVSD